MARTRKELPKPVITRDLFEHLQTQYLEYCNTGKVRVGNQELDNDLGSRDICLDGFIAFTRLYLALNRIASSGYETGKIGVTLSDGMHYSVVDVELPTTNDWNGGISISSMAGQFDLPPAHAIQITKGK